MNDSLTVDGRLSRRVLSFLFGAGMIHAAVMTVRHYFAANFPITGWEGSLCDINGFFNCDSAAFSRISHIGGIPLGYFGVIVGGLVCLGALFPSVRFERTNKSLALVNGIGVAILALYSVFWLDSLCLLCTLYYVFSLLSLWLFWRYGIDRFERSFRRRFFRPSFKHLAAAALITAAGGYGFQAFHAARQAERSGSVATVPSTGSGSNQTVQAEPTNARGSTPGSR